MIITISGTPGSGKSTIAKLLAQKLNLKHFSTGDFMRKIAQERGISLMELTELAESDLSIDQSIDQYSKDLAKQDNFIIDTRLGYHFIPNSIKIFLNADLKTRAQRIFQDKRSEETGTLEELEQEIQKRHQSELKRYQQYYNLDPFNPENFDLLIDTTDLKPEEIVNKILEYLQKQQIL